jgi:integrase
MSNSIKILFWIHRSKKNNEDKAPLMLRLTFKNERLNKSTGIYVPENSWNGPKQKLRGSDEDTETTNSFINATRTKVIQLFNAAQSEGDIYLRNILDLIFHKVEKADTLLKTITVFNESMKSRVGVDFAYSTYEKYVITGKKIKAFLEAGLKKQDIRLKDLSLSFIMDFDDYIRTIDKNQHNTATKYCINLKRILNVAVMRGLISQNPFVGYRTAFKETARTFLSNSEVNLLRDKEIPIPRLDLVKDLFLFQCFTGLAYTDLKSLSKKDITIGIDGNKWIIKARQKTKIIATIPLLPIAMEIIEKYKSCSSTKTWLFPTYSIQKYNEYLVELADLCGINKRISSHVGRRTFGNYALSKGMSLNVIAKILGHANTLITQKIYAVTNELIVSQEINKLRPTEIVGSRKTV